MEHGTPLTLQRISRISPHFPAVVAQLRDIGVEPSGLSPEAFAQYQKEEVKQWAGVVQAAGIKAE